MNGTVDESFDPSSLLAEAKGQKVILNLKGVTRLSSFGVREWTNAMRELCSRVEHVYFVEVSPTIVTQLNMVANFAGSAHVLSVQAPFYCDCGYEAEITYDLREGTINLGTVKCKDCGSTMSFDDDPDSYFQYPLENARSKPMDPNIDVFLRHLSDSFHEETGGMRSFPPPPSEPTNSGVRSSDISIPSRPPISSVVSSPSLSMSIPPVRTGGSVVTGFPNASQDLTMNAPPQRQPAVWMNAKSVLLGLSIPAVLAVLILLLWPSGGSGAGLPDEVQQEYQEHFANQRWGEAAFLIRRLERQRKIEPEVAARYKNEVMSSALAPYGDLLEEERFADGARLVTQAARERVISPRDSTRMHKEVMERAIAKHRELLASEQVSAAEELADSLASDDVLPNALRRSFQNDIALDRQQVTSQLARRASEAFESEQWQQALDATKQIQRLGPMDADMTYLMAESYRRLNREEEADRHYDNFINMVKDEKPPHASLDGALYWRAKHLVTNGRHEEANELFQRVLEIPNSSYREKAARALQK